MSSSNSFVGSGVGGEFILKPTVREAKLYEKMADDRVRCILCERRCVMELGQRSFCRTRINVEGKLYTLVYGDLSSMESRPIEIKPFYHYWPGSTALTFATWSCNFQCPWCQNYTISKTEPDLLNPSYYEPERVSDLALKLGDEGLCASFQEPTILTEWVLDAFKLGSAKGLYCCYVSNGYMTLEALRLLRKSGMDGLKIDVKGDKEVYQRYCGGVDVEVVWRNAEEGKKMGFHVEVVNLVIPGVNDAEECLRWVVEQHLKHVGSETPLHFTRYYPAYKFQNPPTKTETLEYAYKLAKDNGILYPYIGNVQGHWAENTYCPNCNHLLIGRLGYKVTRYRVSAGGRCPNCSHRIPVTGKYLMKPSKFPFG